MFRFAAPWSDSDAMDSSHEERRRLCLIPPDEILAEEFMAPNGISQSRLARDIDVNPARINDIVHGRFAITPTIALRLATYFGTTLEAWMNLQADYEPRAGAGSAVDRAARARPGGGVSATNDRLLRPK
jgi:addiction module HigA family antidote